MMVRRSLFAMLILAALGVRASAQDVKLPETPQGKVVDGYLKAFNAGDERAFLAYQTEHMAEATLARRTTDERKEMFGRMKGDFGQLKVTRVIEAKAESISLAVPTLSGDEATMTFLFDAKVPDKITGIRVEIGG